MKEMQKRISTNGKVKIKYTKHQAERHLWMDRYINES